MARSTREGMSCVWYAVGCAVVEALAETLWCQVRLMIGLTNCNTLQHTATHLSPKPPMPPMPHCCWGCADHCCMGWPMGCCIASICAASCCC